MSLNRSDFLTNLGLRASGSLAPVPSYAPILIIVQFVLSHAIFSTRGAKFRLGIDNNTSPREDVVKAADAVRAGKMTQLDLDKLKRQEAAHQNAIDGLPLFIGAMVFAQTSGLPNDMINRYGVLYVLARLAYHISYVTISDRTTSYVRSVLWWVANIVCIRLFWFSGKALNAGKAI